MARIKSSGGKSAQAKHSSKKHAAATPSKNRVSKNKKAPPPVQQKSKPILGPVKKKQRVYSEKELGIPQLNMITPAGVVAPKGKKKGKVFVDDQESMMTILSIVNASQEGQIESKMVKSRHMEEIREARKAEAEARQEQKKSKFEEVKESVKKRRKKRSGREISPESVGKQPKRVDNPARKRVSFA